MNLPVTLTLIFFASSIQLIYGQDTVDDSSNQLRSRLTSVINNDLGYQKMQELFDQSAEDVKTLDGAQLANELANFLDAHFRSIKEGLNKLVQSIEKHINNFTYKKTNYVKNCHKVYPDETNYRFKTQVSFNYACETRIKGVESHIHAPREVVESMQSIAKTNPDIHRQFFGSEAGVLTLFPGQHRNGPFDKDPRFRPWYVEAESPIPKDIVIVLDASGSMAHNKVNRNGRGKTLLTVAKEAVITVLKTLSPKDKVGLVAFNRDAAVPQGCYSSNCFASKLAVSIPKNTDCLIKFVERIDGHQETNYIRALDKAFDYFINEKPEAMRSRKQVMLFISDGDSKQNHKEVLQKISDLNNKINNSVTILTFGLWHPTADPSFLKLLEDMASQAYTNPTYGEVSPGKLIKITDVNHLRDKLVSYYDHLVRSSSLERKQIFSAPYLDNLGSGAMITVSQPYFANNRLSGVAGIDIVISEIFRNVTYFKVGATSYAFVIDKNRRALSHPLLPTPHSISEPPVVVDISSLERSPKSEEIIKSMLNGESNHLTMYSKRSLGRGSVYREGVNSIDVKSEYYWRPILDGMMSICVVLSDIDKTKVTYRDHSVSRFLYSRFDLIQREDECNHFGEISSTEGTAVKFSPSAFHDEVKYTLKEETRSDVYRWTEYMIGIRRNTDGASKMFKDSIRPMVYATSKVDDIWLVNNLNASNHLVWRLISTTNGIVRVYPSVDIKKEYDHTTRPWFIRGINNPGKIIVTSPYIDTWSSTILITVSKAIYKARISGTRSVSDPAIATLSGDFTVPYFYNIVLESFPVCKESDEYRCFVMDTSGFIVAHEKFVNHGDCSSHNFKFDRMYHVAEMESDIARNLIDLKKLNREGCLNIEDLHVQHYWAYNEADEIQSFTKYATVSNPLEYSLFRVPETNLIVIIRKIAKKTTNYCSCDKLNSTKTARCKTSFPKTCQCPCYMSISQENFDFCSNKFKASRLTDLGPNCTPQPRDNNFFIKRVNASHLPKCFDNKCADKSSKEECLKFNGCYWCSKNRNGLIARPFCTDDSICIGHCSPVIHLRIRISTESSRVLIIIISVIIPTLFVISFIISVMYIYKERQRKRAKQFVDNASKHIYCSPKSDVSNYNGEHDYDIIMYNVGYDNHAVRSPVPSPMFRPISESELSNMPKRCRTPVALPGNNVDYAGSITSSHASYMIPDVVSSNPNGYNAPSRPRQEPVEDTDDATSSIYSFRDPVNSRLVLNPRFLCSSDFPNHLSRGQSTGFLPSSDNWQDHVLPPDSSRIQRQNGFLRETSINPSAGSDRNLVNRPFRSPPPPYDTDV